ncbi:MAG: hypothetical protein A2901_05360 [Elusimicrobia bacterium RIFCSPLOWO2_01_FULL_54_10]|nr:MAG: hypothetical protein A2901_05360 [Elusimicrobia bacterium RIFCSPLOWO2_01_FULL_54_10]
MYATLDINGSTDLVMWNSTASTIDVETAGSLHSRDHDEAADGTGDNGKLFIYGDYHTPATEYWDYDTDFDGTALGGSPRQVTVRVETGAGRGVTVDAGEALQVQGGGGGATQYTDINRIGGAGSWEFQNDAGAERIMQECSLSNMALQAGTLTALNCDVNGNGNTIAGGTLNVDWYLSVHITGGGADIDTTQDDSVNGDVIISENTGSPASTIFRHDGANWGSAATTQRTGTAAGGHIPQPNSAGAIRLRERAETSGGNTFYIYNLVIEAQTCCLAYNYFTEYGTNYVTSSLNSGSGEDEVIDDDWWRSGAIATENAHPGAANDPPVSGTFLADMAVAFTFSLDALAVDLGTLGNANSWTSATLTTTATVTTGASNGYRLTLWATQLLTGLVGGDTIPMWTGTNAAPTNWNGNCPANSECGFGYNTDDATLAGGTADRFVNAGSCGGDSKCWAEFLTTGPGDLVGDDTAPVTADDTVVTYKVSANPGADAAGDYSTTLIFIATPQY